MNTLIRSVMVGFIALGLYAEGWASPSRAVPQPRAPRFVDIPAMVRVQVERALAETGAPEEFRNVAGGEGAKGGGGASFLAMGMAVLLSAISTIIVLRQLARWPGGISGIEAKTARNEEKLAESDVAVQEPGTKEQWSPVRPGRATAKTVGEERHLYDNQTFRLLQSFHRGHGELSLAMRLSSDTRGDRTQDKLQRALPQVESEEPRATVARKLGMGKGEIDLAAHLNELQTSQLRKEKAS